MIQLTAVAQKCAQGFQVTFQFSESSPLLMMMAVDCVNRTPGCRVLSFDNNTIVAQSDLPWELLYQLQHIHDIGGAPITVSYFMNCVMANAQFDVSPEQLAGHLNGKSLLPSQVVLN